MKKLLFCLIAVLAVISIIFFIRKNNTDDANLNVISAADTSSPVKPEYNISTHLIEENETFAKVMEDFGISYGQMLDILDTASSTYDLTNIRVGQPIKLAKDNNGKNIYLEYEINKEYFVRVDFLDNGSYQVKKDQIKYDLQLVRQSGTVSSSLYLDGLSVGVPEGVIVEFGNIFAWTIDFSVQVQKGDSFELLYEKRFKDGKEAGYGSVLAAKFINIGKEYNAYLFEDKNGKPAYYSKEGESLQKQFLKAPLEFNRITSGYTYARFDPVDGRLGKHLAIDYAAVIGTPIMAVADGYIEFAGWSNLGFGNFISIHHNETYTTQYAHLSSFAKGIKKGVPVSQGQVIGYVGSTGHSTGAHLHYQIKKNGSLVNPLKIDLPAGDPVQAEKKEEFHDIINKYEQWLEKLNK